MLSKKVSAILATIFLIVCLSSICSAQTVFTAYKQHDEVTTRNNYVEYRYDDDNEKICFEIDHNAYLHLYNKKSRADYLSFIPYMDNQYNTKFEIREVHTEGPDMTFYEIVAKKYDHNVGYWLIGKSNGRWTSFISYESFMSMGYNPKVTHDLYSSIENGNLVLRTTTEDGRTDFAIQAFWDPSAQWFGMINVTEMYKKMY